MSEPHPSQNLHSFFQPGQKQPLKTGSNSNNFRGCIRLEYNEGSNLKTMNSPSEGSISIRKREWSVYIVRCRDGSLYTGISRNVESRVKRHNSGKGAAYTRMRGPVQLVYQ